MPYLFHNKISLLVSITITIGTSLTNRSAHPMFHTVKVQKSVPSTISMEVICKILCMYLVSYLLFSDYFSKGRTSFAVIFIRRYKGGETKKKKNTISQPYILI